MATTQNRVVNVSDQLYYNGIGPLDAKLTPVKTFADLPLLAAHEGMVIMVLDEQREYKFIDIDGELTWVKNVDTSDLSDKIEAEIERSTAADKAINTKLDKEIKRAVDADEAINAKLDKEIKRAIEVDEALNGKLDDEIKRAVDADGAINSKLDDEIKRAVEADEALNGKLDEEIKRSIEADGAINTKLDEEIARSTDADNRINGKVDAEIERAKKAEDALEDEIINLSGNTEEKIREVLEHSDEQDQAIIDEMRKFVLSDVDVNGVRSVLVPEYDEKGELIANVGKLTLYAENIPFTSGGTRILTDIIDDIKEDVDNLSASTESEIKRLDDKIITEFDSSTDDYLKVDVVPGKSVDVTANIVSIDDAGEFVNKAILENSIGVKYVYIRRKDLDQNEYMGWEDNDGNIRYTKVEPVVGSSLVIYDENFQDVDVLETDSVEKDIKTGLTDAAQIKGLLEVIYSRLDILEYMIKNINGGDIL